MLGGWYGLRSYRNRLLARRVKVRWYIIVALLTAPLAIALTLLALSLVSSDFVPAILSGKVRDCGSHEHGQHSSVCIDRARMSRCRFFRGARVDRRRRAAHARATRASLATGVSVGLVWGAWRFLAIYWGGANAIGSVPVPVYLLVALFSFLVPSRILMTWVYQRTRSALIAVLSACKPSPPAC